MERDEEALFDKLWSAYYLLLKRYAYTLLKSDLLAKEALDQLFCLVAKNVGDIKERPDPTGWLIENMKYIILRLMEDEVYRSALFRGIKQGSITLDAVLPNNISPWEKWLLTERYEKRRTIIEICSAVGISADKCKLDLYTARRLVEEDYIKGEAQGGGVSNE